MAGSRHPETGQKRERSGPAMAGAIRDGGAEAKMWLARTWPGRLGRAQPRACSNGMSAELIAPGYSSDDIVK